MKSLYTTFILISMSISGLCQVDTISNNIYQKDGNLGIGIADPNIKLHIIDSNIQIKVGHQSAYDGPYINIYGSSTEPAPMLGLGLANKEYYLNDDTLTMKKWSYIYGNNLNSGIAILPDLTFASKGVYINREGSVGINTKQPKSQLDVNGGIRIGNTDYNYAGMLRWTGSDFEGYNGNSWRSLTESSTGFWQSKDNNLYYNLGNIGIGTDLPINALTIEGEESAWPGRIFLSVKNKSTGSHSLAYISAKAGTSNNHTIFGHISDTYTANDSPEDIQDYGIISSNGNGMIIGAIKNNLKPGVIKFVSGQSPGTTFNERMRIDSTGMVGIGTKSPSSKLQVADGDIYISDIEKGIIMKSPDGNCWKGVLDNSGQLIFTNIDCPESGNTDIPEYLKSSESVLVFPNPAGNRITVSLDINKIEKPKYAIYNMSGQLEDTDKLKSRNQTIDISNLTNGVYLLSIFDKNGNKLSSEKIIKD